MDQPEQPATPEAAPASHAGRWHGYIQGAGIGGFIALVLVYFLRDEMRATNEYLRGDYTALTRENTVQMARNTDAVKDLPSSLAASQAALLAPLTTEMVKQNQNLEELTESIEEQTRMMREALVNRAAPIEEAAPDGP